MPSCVELGYLFIYVASAAVRVVRVTITADVAMKRINLEYRQKCIYKNCFNFGRGIIQARICWENSLLQHNSIERKGRKIATPQIRGKRLSKVLVECPMSLKSIWSIEERNIIM